MSTAQRLSPEHPRMPVRDPAPDDLRDETAPAALDQTARDLRRGVWLLGVIATLGILVAVRASRDFLLPVIVAGLLAGVLRPPLALLVRRGAPRALAALLVLAAGVGGAVAAVYNLVGPAASWLRNGPEALEGLEVKLRWIRAPLEQLAAATRRLTELAGVRSSAAADIGAPGGGVWDLFGFGRHVAMEVLLALVLLFFLLAAGEGLAQRWVGVLPASVDKRRALAFAATAEKQVSTYLFTVTAINFCLGAAVSFVLSMVGVPNPVLWGVLMGLLNFVPYIGPVVAIGIIAIVSFVSFDDLAHVLAAPLACATLSMIEAYAVTPIVVGKSLAVSPAAVFLALAFWTWMWGVAGAIIAVPTLMVTKIVCDHVGPLAPLGRLLSGRRADGST